MKIIYIYRPKLFFCSPFCFLSLLFICNYVHVYRRKLLELIISFFVGFVVTWFFIKSEDEIPSVKQCPNKESIVRLAEEHGSHKKMMKELKEYSLVQIQQGKYEYVEVLNTLKKKDKNDKA